MRPSSAHSNRLTARQTNLAAVLGGVLLVAACGGNSGSALNKPGTAPLAKLDRRALAALPDPAVITIDTVEALGDAGRDAVAKHIEGAGGSVRWRARATLRAQVPKPLILRLAALAQVVWIEPATTDNGPTR